MATYTSRTVVSTRHEWIVPAAQPGGAAWEEIEKAVLAAWTAYREEYGISSAAIPGDFARFTVTDDAIFISFTTEQPA
ncbi:hypothetical protein AB0953_16675 [Streptomyces sp. NPDC046866]|uniref:hypothetical protein n=1 Tax=Streptomyces sp. NPDC046866 TaxID=3154921 RepID=UPI003456CA6A